MIWGALLCTLSSFVLPAWSIFADEAFHIDYHQSLLGLPLEHSTFFHRPQPSSNASLLYTVSDNAVIGAVNPRDGSIIWRHSLSTQSVEQIFEATLIAGGNGRVVSGYQGSVSAWDAFSGRLSWSYDLPQGEVVVSVRHLGADNTQDDLAVLTSILSGGGRVLRLSQAGNKLLWEFRDSSSDVPLELFASEGHVYYLSQSSGLLSATKTKTVVLDVSNGREVRQASLSLTAESLLYSSLSCPEPGSSLPVVASAEAPFKAIKFGSLETGKTATVSLAEKSEAVKSISIRQSCHTIAGKHHVLVHVRGEQKQWAEVFHVDARSGEAKLAYALPALGEVSVFASTAVGTSQYFSRITDSDVTLYSSESHGQLGRWARQRSGPASTSSSDKAHAVAEVVARGRTGAAVRIAELSDDGEWSLTRNGESQWTRPEFLANTIKAVWTDESVADPLAGNTEKDTARNPLSAYVQRWTRHLEGFQHIPGLFSHLFKILFTPAGFSTESSNKLVGSYTVIVGTSRLEVAALDAVEIGSVRWRVSLTPIAGTNNELISLSVHEGRVTAYLSDQTFAVIDIASGSLLEHKKSTAATEKIVEIPGHPAATVLTFGTDGQPKLLSDASPSSATEGNILVNVGHSGEASAWSVGRDVHPLWTMRPAGGKFVHGAFRTASEPVASIGRVMGNRTVLYKYLSPNLALLTAVSEISETLSMYLVEAVSGDILQVSTHQGLDISFPISSAVSENWFTYSFTTQDPATQAPTHYLVSSELFESPHTNDRGPIPNTANYSTTAPGSSSNPHIVTQSFILTEPISHMSVSQTSQGITSRQLLAVLPESSAIIGLHRYMLDPRRPVNRDPTSLELEEGLTRYHPVLPLDPKLYLTHSREVVGIKKLISRPTRLESTSLVFGFGHDIFGTRLTPSLAYDVLSPAFNKVQLLMTVVALFVGVVVLAPMARSRQAETRWKGG